MADREYEVEVVRLDSAIAKRQRENWRDEIEASALCCIRYRSTNYVQRSPYGWDKITLSTSRVTFEQACQMLQVLYPECSFVPSRG